jgi:hypothetical protein
VKKKKISRPEAAEGIDDAILEQAKAALRSDRIPKPQRRCVICGGESAPNSSESLCWVCRRLKISAWREIEQSMPAQE